MAPRKRRTPALRVPPLPPWDGGDHWPCGTPVRRLWIGQTLVHVGMKPAPRSDPRATIAAVTMNNRLEGRWLGKGEHAEQIETVWIPHQDVCPENPTRPAPPTQLELPQEGTT